jgi:glutamine synthetase
MAKFDARQAGSSFHLHSSLWKGKKNVTPPHWLGGLMSAARDFSLFTAPTVNSYKRYQAASFAPTKIAWAHDNRTVGFRVLDDRVENRLPGADANPYLAFAATIAAGLRGIEEKIQPPAEFKGDAYEADLPSVPMTLAEAIEAWVRSPLAREAFGAEVVEHYAHAARLEQSAFDRSVTGWERERYFERI